MSALHLRLPKERFFWALLDVEALPRPRRRDPQALGYLFESMLPVPIEQVHAAYVPSAMDPACIVACGTDKNALAEVIAEHPEALTLGPQALPSFIADTAIDVIQLNLLTGEFEPQPMRRAKRRIMLHAALLLAMATVIIIVGVQRRIAAIHQQTSALADARRDIILSTIDQAASSTQPPELRMLAELRSLQQTRGRTTGLPAADDSQSADVLASLAQLVGGWPGDLHVRTDSIVITPTSMTMHGLVPTSADAQSLADALTHLDGWRLEQPQINATGSDEINATLQWKRERILRANASESAP